MKRHICGLLFTLLPALPAAASTAVALSPADITRVQALEEILVTGDRDSLSAARKAAADAEERFYERYNAGNDDHAYDMVCSERAPTGTLIRQRMCLPKLVDDAMAEETARLVRGQGSTGVMLNPDALRQNAMVEVKRRLRERVAKDPELLRALLEHARLQSHLAALHQRKFEDRWIVWD
ncbi:MAG: hypothetical protein RL026_2332 [Pseudomonadota bacterium]|jgi:hypothetical protein